MKLVVGDRQIARPESKTNASRGIDIGTAGPSAVSNMSKQLQQMGEIVARQVKAAEDAAEYSTVISDAKTKIAGYYSTRSRDTENYGTLSKDVGEYIKDLKAETVNGISGVDQQSRVLDAFDQLSVAYHGKAVGDSTQMAISSVKADMVLARASMIQDASIGDDNHASGVMLEYADMQRTMVRTGIVEADAAEKDILDFASDAVRGKVRTLMNTDPYQAEKYLLDTDNNLSRLLNPEHRENLLAQTSRLINQIEAKAERERKAAEAAEEKLLKKTRDAVYQLSFRDIRDGTMTIERLDALMQASLLHKSDYDGLYKAYLNRNKDTVGKPEIYNGMKSMVWLGEIDQREILAAVNDEQINWTMADELLNELEQGASVVQSEEYKTYLNSLKTKLGWTMTGSYTNDQAILIGNAQVEFRRRAINGENIQQIFDDLSVRYSKTMTEVVEKPRFKTIEEAKRRLKPGPALDREINLQRVHNQRVAEDAAYEKQLQENQK